MIRWYDYPAAFLAADVMMFVAFNIPWVGFVVAYAAYDIGWKAYCELRLRQENER